MTRLRKKSEEIRTFILDHVGKDPKKTVSLTMDKFNISRQAVHRHIKTLVDQGALIRSGSGKYQMAFPEEWQTELSVLHNLEEHIVWENEIRERLGQLPDNVMRIWRYCFTEIFNNVIDHSGSNAVIVRIRKNPYFTEMHIGDLGIGIFKKIKTALNLPDERQSVLELTKGRLTTDRTHHSGEGIFFTSRMLDKFQILSGEIFLSHKSGEKSDWLLENQEYKDGTWVFMTLSNSTQRTDKEIFIKFGPESDDYGFNKTVVPVRLAQYGDEELIARSQAKRLLARIDHFKTVILDFDGVQSIGRAFADEVFRVYANEHPHVELVPIYTEDAVLETIRGVLQSVGDK